MQRNHGIIIIYIYIWEYFSGEENMFLNNEWENLFLIIINNNNS